MPALTSVKSGYWSDPTTWDLGVVPANGDTVTIAAGHTVIFDVDQTNFANGLAGLTINGTLKFPSQSEDGNMPQFVHLKVNANIAGTGSLLVGSSTYPITHPQQVKISVNGTITVATVNMYGEQRRPCFDYLAQDAASGATTIVLTEGMPLRAGDTIAIGRSDVRETVANTGIPYTVTAYDAPTKTVTISPSLSTARRGGEPYGCLVILLTRQIVVEKYGGNNVSAVGGSGRTFQGVLFRKVSDASGTWGAEVSSSSFYDCSAHYVGIRVTDGNIRYTTVSFPDGTTLSLSSNVTVSDSAIVVGTFSRFDAGTFTISNTHKQNIRYPYGGSGYASINVNGGATKNCWRGWHSDSHSGYKLIATNVKIVDVERVIDGVNINYAKLEDINIYNRLGSTTILWRGVSGYATLRNFTITNDAAVTVTLALNAANALLENITVQGQGSCSFGWNSCLFRNIRIATNLASPPGNFSGKSLIYKLSVPTYSRNLVLSSIGGLTLDNNQEMVFVDVRDITIAGTNYPKAFERIWNYGYLKNRWDATTPDYTTFDFYLTNTSLAKPMYLDYRVRGDNPIVVTGNITQLANGDTVKVQIFRADKEPLLGDTPDYEQIYTATGAINVSWTPPSADEWIVRVSVTMQQTTTPTTIANLEVGGGTAGEPSFVWMG